MGYTYSAFISYRHLPADIEAAKAVQRALETYRIPADIRKKTGVQNIVNSVLYTRITEECCNKLTASLRLVTA